MSLAPKLVGEETETSFKPRCGIGDPLGTGGGEERPFHSLYGKFRMGVEEVGNDPLVFFRCEGTGRIYQTTAGGKHLCRRTEDLRLPSCAHGDGFRAPVCNSRIFLAEHALTGAGGIYQNAVKIQGEALFQFGRVLIEYQSIGDAQAFNIGC